MHLKDFELAFEKRAASSGLEYRIRPPTQEAAIDAAEGFLRVEFPQQLRDFYSVCNGFLVPSPHIEILRIEALNFIRQDLLHFCTIEQCHSLCFDTSHLNEARQWCILDAETNFRVTYTMASFWSNKVWTWV